MLRTLKHALMVTYDCVLGNTMQYQSINEGLAAFLNNAAQIKELTAPQERSLGRQVQLGLISEDPALIKAGDRARVKFVRHNIMLAVKVANKFARVADVEDLIQEGCCGLDVAARGYDPERGNRFSTYAWPWVMNYVRRAAKRDRLIALPVWAHNIGNAIVKAEELLEHTSRPINPETIFQCIKTGEIKVDKTEREKLTRMNLGRLLESMSIKSTISLNTYHGESDSIELIEMIESADEPEIIDDSIKLLAEKLLLALPKDEQYILRGRLGFSGEVLSVPAIAEHLNMQKPMAVHHIKRKALARCRRNPAIAGLELAGIL